METARHCCVDITVFEEKNKMGELMEEEEGGKERWRDGVRTTVIDLLS